MENENANNQEEQEKKDEALKQVEDNAGDNPPADDGEGKPKEFDPTAFSQTEVPKKTETDVENKEEKPKGEDGETPKPDGDGEAEEFDWATYDEPNPNPDEDKGDEDKNKPSEDSMKPSEDNKVANNEEFKEQKQDEQQASANDAYKAVADELGLEAESIDDLKETLQSIQDENKRLREQSLGGVSNDTIAKLEGFKDKSDEDLVKLELSKQGFSEEEVQNALDGYTDNNTLWIEAKKIRNTINGAIKSEQQKIARSEQEASATQEQSRIEAVKSLTEHINNQDTMFGFKMAKDEEGLKKVREGHIKYITSGDFLADVTKDNKNLNEAAWLWKNKDVIQKAIGSREFNKGKQTIMDDINNPDVSDKSRFKDPGGSDEFDPKAFTYGQNS